MTTSELLEFIRIEHALGMSLDEITRLLIDEGEWDAADVAEAFRALGLPEDAVERYTMKAAGIVPPPLRVPAVEPPPLPPPPPAVAPVVRHAPAPQPIAGPRDMEYVKHAAPMQYVEQPEPKPVPVLARPATLVGQGARPLVRTTTQPSSMAAAPMHAVRPGHIAPTVHISRVQQPQQKPAPVSAPTPAPIAKPVMPIVEAPAPAHAPASPVKFTFVPSTKEAAVPLQPAAPVAPLQSPAPIAPQAVAHVARPTPEPIAPLFSPKSATPSLPHEAKREALTSFDFEVGGGSTPVYQPKKAEAVPLPKIAVEKKVVAPLAPEALGEKPKFTPPPAQPMPAQRSAEQPKLVPPPVAVSKPIEAPVHIEEPKPVPVPAPTPTPTPTPAPAPKPVEIPKPIEEARPIVPPAPVAPTVATPPPPPPAPTTLQPIFITMPTFGPEQIQAMQQQYMGMMGGAPMGAGLQPAVAPTIIYNQTVAPPPPPVSAMPLPPLPPPPPPEPKKPEPIRFDIGRVRDTRKMEQSISGGKPSILAAVTGMQPVGSTNIEDVFKSQMGGEVAEDSTVEKSTIVHSLKVPHKRTMAGDLVRMQEGIMPEQVVSQTVKTTAIAGVALPDHPGQSGPQSGLPSPETMVDDMPIPPPPKKSGKPITLITFSVLGILAAFGLAAYYFLFYRLPPADEIYKNAVVQLLIAPGVSYNASLSIEATSTEAEPELIRAQAMASGTAYMKKNAFGDGVHALKFNLAQVGAPQPINIGFDGDVRVVGNDVYVKQNSPTLNTPLADLLDASSWIKIPYTQLGLAFGLVGSSTVTQGDYTAITPATSLSSLLSTNAPLRVVGSVEKFTRDNREYYRVPLILDSGKAVAMDELLGNYLRGSAAVKNSADRVAQLTERFKNITGEVIVDKLLLRPIAFSLSANYDPSKIAFTGTVRLNMAFKYVPAHPVTAPEGKTLDELRALRAGEAGAQEIIARDAPARSMISIISVALGQYAEKAKRYPASLMTLVANNFISKDALTPDILNRIVYVAYVNKPTDGNDGVHCTDKNPTCNFFHVGTTLEYKSSSELQTDADYTSPAISGGDSAGCVNEVDRSCYDLIGNLSTDTAPSVTPNGFPPTPTPVPGTTTKAKLP